MVPGGSGRINYNQAMEEQRSARADAWPPYDVVCVRFDEYGVELGHRHLRAIDTRDQDGQTTQWGVPEIMAALRTNERFVLSRGEGGEASLGLGLCPACPFMTLRFEPPGEVPTCD